MRSLLYCLFDNVCASRLLNERSYARRRRGSAGSARSWWRLIPSVIEAVARNSSATVCCLYHRCGWSVLDYLVRTKLASFDIPQISSRWRVVSNSDVQEP